MSRGHMDDSDSRRRQIGLTHNLDDRDLSKEELIRVHWTLQTFFFVNAVPELQEMEERQKGGRED